MGKRTDIRSFLSKRCASTRLVVAIGSACALVAAGVAFGVGSASAATLSPHTTPTAPCTVTIAAGSGTVVPGGLIVGVTAGTTQVKLDCNSSSQAALAIEASLFTSISSSNVIPTGEVDANALASFAASPTDTGCPAATAGMCEIATVAIPATYSAADPNAMCPPSQAQINAGIFGCAIAAITASDVAVPGAEFLVQYASQTTAPNPPTIAALQSTGSVGSNINVSDAAGHTGYWWGNANQVTQALGAGVAPQPAPATCGPGGGYGDVPNATLMTLWFAAGSTAPIMGSAAGVTISNNCYNGATLSAPVLGGVVPVPATAVAGTTYTVYLCELNVTPYQSTVTSPCGADFNGYGWIDASFNFAVAAKVVSQNLPESGAATAVGSAGFTDQLVTSGNTGAVTYTQTSGTPSLVVSSSGGVTTAGTLSAGTYTASGTTSDASGDTGTFTFSLSVTGTIPTPKPKPRPRPPAPRALRVVGRAILGRTVIITILGRDFTARPRVFAHAGTFITVLRVTKFRITLRVREVLRVRRGAYLLVIRFASGKRTAIRYFVV